VLDKNDTLIYYFLRLMNWKNVLIGLAAVVFFSFIFLLGVFDRLGDKVFDFLLAFRPDREDINEFVFLDVDDNAIAYNGVFPWPRSITAEGLLRLKEYGARAAIFDIEYLDKGPQGVDTIYLKDGLPADFSTSFSDINLYTSTIFSALKNGRIKMGDLDVESQRLSEFIRNEHDNLLTRAKRVARDNDLYLIQASALFGRSWVSLNLREEALIDDEQAGRRPIAEENFSYPVNAKANAVKGKYVDVLPALPGFALTAEGAGFTNVEIDDDGTRRRIDLAQNIHDHWYLQLAFSPLVNFLGKPEIQLDNRKLLMKNAKMPGGIVKDITSPLDGYGRMVLDWPKKDYGESYSHISFYDFSLLENLEAELEHYAKDISSFDIIYDFARFDPALMRIPFITNNLSDLFDVIDNYRNAALENCSDEYFEAFVDYRKESRNILRELLDIDPVTRINTVAQEIAEMVPESAISILNEAERIGSVLKNLSINLERYESVRVKIESMVKDRFCILGRVDTGTTDYGANPFHGKYINVGTHGVVLDMILSESFIVPLGIQWQIIVTIVFVFLFFFASGNFAPVIRAITGFLAVVLAIAGSALLFHYTSYYLNPLLTAFSMISAVIAREIISYAGSEREKQFIRKAFSTYVSDDVVKEIIVDPSRLQLGGTKRHMSAIFTDVQGFSSISEQLDPEHLVSLLNRYLTFMSDAILEEKGTIDKYEGDAIIAFFGAPMPLEDHALRACTSAIAIKQIEKELNKKIMEEKLSPKPLYTRIGINTGSMVAGNMGTGNKMNYTIMGNAVNLAARLEGVNKQYGTWILASQSTAEEAGDSILTRKLDRVRVVGINEPVRLHELINMADYASPDEKKLVEVFDQARELYENRKWKEAIEGFKESMSIENGGPSAIYLRRCENFLKNPPDDAWDGVNNLTEK
jgi:adenylate cyclase